MQPERVQSRKTGKKGWRYRYTNPVTGGRTYHTEWFVDQRDADKGFRNHLEGLEAVKIGLPDKNDWRLPYEKLVQRFLEDAPIETEDRRKNLSRWLRANPLGLAMTAEFTKPGKLTATALRLIDSKTITDDYAQMRATAS